MEKLQFILGFLCQGDDAVDEEAVANFCLMYSVFLVPSNYLVLI